MNARMLLASAAMSATLLMSLTQVAAADEAKTQPAVRKETAARAPAQRARAARRPTVRPVAGNGKRPQYMKPAARPPAPVVVVPAEPKADAGKRG